MNNLRASDERGGNREGGGNGALSRFIAFFLPQFHPIPENDVWWGKGFTEWTNVTRAKPLFEGHYQPHLPADLGFYDLRVCATRREQIKLAKEYGIDGFCYHYYWFSGKRLLHQPVDDMLRDPQSDMPFCLCWANENWTRRWDGAEHEVLIAQQYLPDDDVNFVKSVVPFFSDPRYIRFNGAPLLIVYAPQHLPNVKKSVSIWREFCRSAGIGEIHLCAALTHGNDDYPRFGFDSGVEFPPHNNRCENVAFQVAFHKPFLGYVSRYQEMARAYLERDYTNRNVFKSVFPSWDNTPRRGSRGVIVLGATPSNYEFWLSETVRKTVKDFPGEERFVFINAWNEWAEGCHLEPDQQFGHQFLEATLRVKTGKTKSTGFSGEALLSTVGGSERTLSGDFHSIIAYHAWKFFGRFASWVKKHPRIKRFVRWLLRRGR